MRSDVLQTETHETSIEDLTQVLAQLRVAQERVSAVLNRIESERQINIRTRSLVETLSKQSAAVGQRTSPPQRRRLVHPLVRFTYSDHISVKNPKTGQHDQGIVFGATRSALVKVRSEDGNEVRRLSKNLILLQTADERNRAEAAATRQRTAGIQQ